MIRHPTRLRSKITSHLIRTKRGRRQTRSLTRIRTHHIRNQQRSHRRNSRSRNMRPMNQRSTRSTITHRLTPMTQPIRVPTQSIMRSRTKSRRRRIRPLTRKRRSVNPTRNKQRILPLNNFIRHIPSSSTSHHRHTPRLRHTRTLQQNNPQRKSAPSERKENRPGQPLTN